MVATADSSDQTVDKDPGPAAVAKGPLAAQSADHGGDSACWAHLVCPECGATSSDGHHQGCGSEQGARTSTAVEIDEPAIRADHADALSNEKASALAERSLMHRILVWTAIGVPVGATFFGLLVFVGARLAASPAGAPVAMGAVVGVLAGVFFGMWGRRGSTSLLSKSKRLSSSGCARLMIARPVQTTTPMCTSPDCTLQTSYCRTTTIVSAIEPKLQSGCTGVSPLT